jgi:hypothetical protein
VQGDKPAAQLLNRGPCPTWHSTKDRKELLCCRQHPVVCGHLLQAQACMRVQLKKPPDQVPALWEGGLTAAACHHPQPEPWPTPTTASNAKVGGHLQIPKGETEAQRGDSYSPSSVELLPFVVSSLVRPSPSSTSSPQCVG